MKRSISIILFICFIAVTAGCSSKDHAWNTLSKEGLAPYELSDSEKYILESFDMYDTSQMILFNAPKEAISLYVSVYRLEEGGKWLDIGGGSISIGADRKPADKLTGAFAMQLKDNYAIDFVINAAGKASFKTDEILLDHDMVAATKGFLQEFQEIKMNAEIPVAFMVYDGGTSMKSYSLQDYFESSRFDGMDLVQVVTLKFSDQQEPAA